MSAAPGAEQFPDELELLDGSGLCLRELQVENSLRALRTLADDYELQHLTGDLDQPETHEKAQRELTGASQKLIWHLYDTGIFIAREEDFDSTKRMTSELARRIHDAFGIDNIRPDGRTETPLGAPRESHASQDHAVVACITEKSPDTLTKPVYIQLVATNTANQLERDLFTSLGVHIDTLHPGIADRVDHDDFIQTMISLRHLGRVSLAAPLLYGADKLRTLSRLAEQIATKVAS